MLCDVIAEKGDDAGNSTVEINDVYEVAIESQVRL